MKTFHWLKPDRRSLMLAAGLGVVLVATDYYFLNPFDLRHRGAVMQYVLSGALALLVSLALTIALQSARSWQSSWVAKAGMALLVIPLVAYLAYLYIPATLYATRFTVSQLDIIATGEKNPSAANDMVHLQRLLGVDQTPVNLTRLTQTGEWRVVSGGLISDGEQPAQLHDSFLGGQGQNVQVVFASGPESGIVRVSVNGVEQQIDLYSPTFQETTVTLPVTGKLGSLFLEIVRWFNIIVAGMILSLPLTRLEKPIYAWFDDLTPRLQAIAVPVVIFSILITLFGISDLFYPNTAAPLPPSPAGQKPPNVIFIVVDALTAEDMSLYGYPLPTTPNLDRITRTWTVYTHAQAAGSGSITDLPVVLTGRYPYLTPYYRYGDVMRSQPGWLNLADILQASGYETIWHGYLSPGFYHLGKYFDRSVCKRGLAAFLDRTRYQIRATPYEDSQIFPLTFWLAKVSVGEKSEEYESCDALSGFQQIIKNRDANRPLYLYIHERGVHGGPYRGGPYQGTFLPLEQGLLSESDQKTYYGPYQLENQRFVDQLRLRYDEAIRYQDEQLNEIIETLKAAGQYDNALIIITSDHGQNFHNGYVAHATPLLSYPETHIPLLIKYPYQTEGQRVDQMVSSVDLVPTILDTLKYQYAPDWVDGQSLLGQPAAQRIIFSRRPIAYGITAKVYAAADENYRLVQRENGLWLFNHQEDPTEQHNLWGENSIDPQILERLQAAIQAYDARADFLIRSNDVLNAPPLP